MTESYYTHVDTKIIDDLKARCDDLEQTVQSLERKLHDLELKLWAMETDGR